KAQRRLPQVTSSFAYRAPDRTFWFSGEGCLWHLVGHDFARVNLPREVANQFAFLQAITKERNPQNFTWFSARRQPLPAVLQAFAKWYRGYIPSQLWPKPGFSCRGLSDTPLHPGQR